MKKLGSLAMVVGMFMASACVNAPADSDENDELGEVASEVAEQRAPESIQSVVRAHFGGFRACYEAGLERDPTMSGKIAMQFVIDLDGSVMETKVGEDTTLTDSEFQECMLDRFDELEFDAAAVSTTVTYPIVMTPG